MNILFIADPLDSFKTYKDSSFAMMREAARRGHRIYSCELPQLRWSQTAGVVAQVQALLLTPPKAFAAVQSSEEKPASAAQWYQVSAHLSRALREFDAVLMRKDPPFDAEYFCATHLLQQAEREGAKVFNSPRALREHPEKLALMEFAHWAAPTLVSRDMSELRAFHERERDVIYKPLDGMGGMGIFRVREDGMNLGAVIEQLSANGDRSIMAQRYLPAISAGDKRILLIDGEPVPYCLARIPQGGEVRGNLAAGGLGVAQALSESDWRIAKALGPVLAERGLLLVGLDVIGEHLTEINVTSPTCFQEITQQTGFDVAACFIDALEKQAV